MSAVTSAPARAHDWSTDRRPGTEDPEAVHRTAAPAGGGAAVPASDHVAGFRARIDDWDVMFDAVMARLRQTVGSPETAQLRAPSKWRAGALQADVLECVEALGQLHASLAQERARHDLLALRRVEIDADLLQCRAELVQSRARELVARQLAQHDGLTSLPNRTFFCERLTDALTQAEPQQQALAVLYLDLDGFKPINDRHGHDVGDDVLRIVAARLSRAVRSEDMVCRLGGDEFACLLSNLPSRAQLSQLARKLFVSISDPVMIGGLELIVRPSIGIAVFPEDGASFDSLLKSADAAMYRAKLRHSGHAFCDARGQL